MKCAERIKLKARTPDIKHVHTAQSQISQECERMYERAEVDAFNLSAQ